METGQALPYEEDDDPVLFMKPDTALLQGDRNRFYIPGFSSDIHYETELVVRIDKMGKNIGERFACRYYSEITLGIDFTVRDIQAGLKQRSRPWEISKAFDHSAAVGAFVSKEKYGKSVQELDFHLKIDDKAVQSANTSGMIHTVDKIVAFASRFFTLKTGDLIFTGTPAGAGRVETGNILRGFLEDDELLDLHIC
jgi:2-keto-4-pentenoate hydratase/2-oxohepta-3-ene-1,7-dioic acid hydratase in catechol pathway